MVGHWMSVNACSRTRCPVLLLGTWLVAWRGTVKSSTKRRETGVENTPSTARTPLWSPPISARLNQRFSAPISRLRPTAAIENANPQANAA